MRVITKSELEVAGPSQIKSHHSWISHFVTYVFYYIKESTNRLFLDDVFLIFTSPAVFTMDSQNYNLHSLNLNTYVQLQSFDSGKVGTCSDEPYVLPF